MAEGCALPVLHMMHCSWMMMTAWQTCCCRIPCHCRCGFSGMLRCAVLRCAALCCAVLRCAVLCCAVLCCAVLFCAVLCCVNFDCMQGDSDKIKQASGHSAHAHLDVPCRIINRCTLPKGNTQLSCLAANCSSCHLPFLC